MHCPIIVTFNANNLDCVYKDATIENSYKLWGAQEGVKVYLDMKYQLWPSFPVALVGGSIIWSHNTDFYPTWVQLRFFIVVFINQKLA